MKKLLTLLLSLSVVLSTYAQLNVSYISDVPYNVDLNDIWGYAAPDGTEYALVGLSNGVSIVSLADPANPVIVATIPGGNTIWRDIKTWQQTAYVTCDSCNDGLLVIDLSDLPNSAPYFNWFDVPGGGIESCHNIYIDEFGYAYLAGCNANSGGMVFLDCFSTPGSPSFAGFAPATYSHDVYVRDNKMYGSEIYQGRFAIYDVANKGSVQLLGSHETAAQFTHNTWLSDDGNYLFTTDETANAPLGSYDVSDPADIIELDQFRPLETLGEGVIPHNTHVWNDYNIVSYYTDGCIIVDGARPHNLVMVGNFDTYFPANSGFSGAWGAYPFLPSGLILVSDIGNGLFVLQPNYVRACYLEGVVTDADTGAGLSGVSIEISTTELYDVSNQPSGDYATGLAIPGVFQVTYSKPGYYPQTFEVTFENGELVLQDVMLVPLEMATLAGTVVDAMTGNPVPFADVIISGGGEVFVNAADGAGYFSLSVFEGNFEVVAGAWGHKYGSTSLDVTGATSGILVELEQGYQDDYISDYGWSVSGNANAGEWERGEPQGTTYNGSQSNPDNDVSGDYGDLCYVTGNGGGGAGSDDVDDGTTTLTSPVMDLSNYNNPVVSFQYWFFNDGGNGTPNDELTVSVSNGSNEVVLATYDNSNSSWQGPVEFQLLGQIVLTSNMRIIFETSDNSNSGHLVEAAIDAFLVEDSSEQVFIPNFTTTNTTGCAPSSIQFTDNTSGATSWSWSFPGGTPSTSSEANPSVTYLMPGNYSVTLEVTNADGESGTVNETNLIQLDAFPEPDFSWSENENVVTFINTSTGANSYFWDFGDGNTSTAVNPVHDYGVPGVYVATLTATNDCGSLSLGSNIGNPTGIGEIDKDAFNLRAMPNPFSDVLDLQYEIKDATANAKLQIYNLLGEHVQTIGLSSKKGSITLGENLTSGIYFITIRAGQQYSEALRVVKMK